MATTRDASAERATSSDELKDWHLIDWGLVQRFVGKLQMRIAQAELDKDFRRVKNLQRSLVRSWQAKALAVRKVTENQGKRTSGIDRELWQTPEAKWNAVCRLNKSGIQGQATAARLHPESERKGEAIWASRPCSTGRCRHYTCSRWNQSRSARPIRTATAFGKDGQRTMRGASCLCRCPEGVSAQWILDADITGFFDNINHDWLLAMFT
jgi:RNA-directed DNA polymerase